MQTRRQFLFRAVWALSFVGGAGVALADAFPDGAPTQLCAISNVQICEQGKTCQEQPPGQNESIRFVKFSLPERLAISTLSNGQQRTTIIERVRPEGDIVMLAGGEPRRAWSAVLEAATARLTLTLAEPGRGFVLSGRCTPEQ